VSASFAAAIEAEREQWKASCQNVGDGIDSLDNHLVNHSSLKASRMRDCRV
jgi:hypothetical protein